MEKYQNKNLFFAFDVIYKKRFFVNFFEEKVITNDHVSVCFSKLKWEKFVKQNYENFYLRSL